MSSVRELVKVIKHFQSSHPVVLSYCDSCNERISTAIEAVEQEDGKSDCCDCEMQTTCRDPEDRKRRGTCIKIPRKIACPTREAWMARWCKERSRSTEYRKNRRCNWIENRSTKASDRAYYCPDGGRSDCPALKEMPQGSPCPTCEAWAKKLGRIKRLVDRRRHAFAGGNDYEKGVMNAYECIYEFACELEADREKGGAT